MVERLKPEELAKLPKWARIHLDACYWTIASLTRDKAALFGKTDEAPRVILPYFYGVDLDGSCDQPLGDWQHARFRFPDRPIGRDYIEVGIDQTVDCLSVMGVDTLQIEPRASNSVRVRLARL